MENYILLIRVFVVVLLGCYTKEYFDIIDRNKQQKDISISKVLLSALGTTIIIFGLNDLIVVRYGENAAIVITYITGLGGYKLIKSLTMLNVKDILPILERIKQEEGDD